jgi:hypothetical protein
MERQRKDFVAELTEKKNLREASLEASKGLRNNLGKIEEVEALTKTSLAEGKEKVRKEIREEEERRVPIDERISELEEALKSWDKNDRGIEEERRETRNIFVWEGKETKLELHLLPRDGKAKTTETVNWLQGQLTQVDQGNVLELVGFLEQLQLFCQGRQVGGATIEMALRGMPRDLKEKWSLSSRDSLEEISEIWTGLFKKGTETVTRANFYRSKRRVGERLGQCLGRMVDLIHLLTQMSSLTDEEAVAFLMSAQFLNGWGTLNPGWMRVLRQEAPRNLRQLRGALMKLEGDKAIQEIVEAKAQPGRHHQNQKEVATATKPSVSPAPPLEGQVPMAEKFESLICHNCGKKGHIKVYCPDLELKKRQELEDKWKSKHTKKEEKTHTNNEKEDLNYFQGKWCGFMREELGDSDLWEVQGQIVGEEKKIRVALDTFAEVNVVEESVLGRGRKLDKTSVRLHGVGGGQVKPKGQVNLKIQINGKTLSETFVVVADGQIPRPIVVGFRALVDAGFQLPRVKTGEKHEAEDTTEALEKVLLPMMKDMGEYFGRTDGEDQVEGNFMNEGDFPLQEKLDAAEEEEIDHALDQLVLQAECSAATRKELKKVLFEHREVFVHTLKKPGQVGKPVSLEVTGVIKHQRKRHIFPPSKATWMQEKVDAYEAFGYCRKLKPGERVGHIANLVGVDNGRKKRITQDFTEVNKGTKDVLYPLARPDEARMNQGKARWFSVVDEIECYHQYGLDTESQKLTAFYGPMKDAIYIWLVMPQGLKQCPAWLHERKDFQFSTFSKDELAYTFDDTLLMSESEGQHLRIIEKMLSQVKSIGGKLKVSKCKFFRSEVKFDGFIVSEGKWEKDEEAVEPILRYPVPRTAKELKRFLGMANVYQHMIPKYSQMVQELFKYVKKEVIWTEDMRSEITPLVETVKRTLARAVMLTTPDWTRPFHFFVDSGPQEGMAAAVTQEHLLDGKSTGVFDAVHFYARRSTGGERKLWPTEMELAGVKWAMVDKGRRYTYGKSFLHVDAQSLKDLKLDREGLHKSTRKRLINDLLELQNFKNVDIVWHPRAELEHIDALNRVPRIREEREHKVWMDWEMQETTLEICVKTVAATYLDKATPANLREEQGRDPICAFVRQKLEHKEELSVQEKLRAEEDDKKLWESLPDYAKKKITSYRDTDEGLSKFYWDKDEKLLMYRDSLGDAIVAPYSLKKRILSAYHDSYLAGHRGRKVLKEALVGKFYWMGRSQDVIRYISDCEKCQRSKVSRQEYAGLKPIKKGRAFEKINMDFVGPLTKAADGSKYLLVMVCATSGEVRLWSTKTRSGREVAQGFLEKLILRGDTPQVLQTDNAKEFVDGMLKALNRLLGIAGIAGSPYHPQVNGAVERKNATIGTYLRMFSNAAQTNWPEMLPFVELSMNSAVNPAIGMSPFFFNKGYDSLDILFNAYAPRPKDKKDEKQFLEWLRAMELTRELAGQTTRKYQEKMKEQHDKGKKEHNFQVGEKVWVFFPRGRKLDKIWHGPYVIEAFNDEYKRTATIHHEKWTKDKMFMTVTRLTRRSEVPKELLEDQGMANWRQKMMRDATQDALVEEERDMIEIESNFGKQGDQKAELIPPKDKQEDDEDDEFEVEKIIGHRTKEVKQGKRKGDIFREFLVRWKGFSPEADTWEPEEGLRNTARDSVEKYEIDNKLDMKIQTNNRRQKR